VLPATSDGPDQHSARSATRVTAIRDTAIRDTAIRDTATRDTATRPTGPLDHAMSSNAGSERSTTTTPPATSPADAELIELSPSATSKGWRRVLAGLLVEQGLVDKAVAKRLQDQVIAGRFDADAAASELLSAVRSDDPERAVERRCADLERDLIMAPRMRGAQGAARKVREAGRRGVAYLVVQSIVVMVFVVLFAASLLAARYAGHDLHQPVDTVLGWLGLEPGSAATE
jgi:hypothetical protein